jgi:two-component system sensor histidine kinase and response regulator WspE
VQDISAAALTEDGQPVLIIDVDDLFRTVEAHIAEGSAGHRAAATAKSDKPLPSAKTVLVIDDSLTVREIERQLLQAHGYRVDVAVDGMDGWNAVRRKKYQLVITDVDMPRMDGIELLHAIRQDNHLKSLPVMIVSYKDRPEDKQRGLDAGADYYLTKGSFHDETLIEAVMDLIGEAFA